MKQISRRDFVLVAGVTWTWHKAVSRRPEKQIQRRRISEIENIVLNLG